MRILLVRQFIGGIGLSIALAIGVLPPVSFGLITYGDLQTLLNFRAQVSAGKLAKHIYMQGDMWQYQSGRVAELLEQSEQTNLPIRQRVYDSKGRLMVEDGPAILTPSATHAMPIRINGERVGSIEVETSLLPMLRTIGLVAVISMGLALVAFVLMRVLPLRLLDRTLDKLAIANREIIKKNSSLHEQNSSLRERDRQLAMQNLRFDAAINHMSQGLCMFDSGNTLVVSNQRFNEIYGLDSEICQPGVSLRSLIAHCIVIGNHEETDVDQMVARKLALIAERRACVVLEELADGRIISIAHEPMADGGWVATYEDVTERKRAEARIAHMAKHDALTNLPNRACFRERMEEALARLQRHGESFVLVCLDLDMFKAVNDTLGHPIGDQLLWAVAERLASCVRSTDVIARLGGDEFAVLQMSPAHQSDAAILAERLIAAIGEPYDIEGQKVVIGVSAGIALAPSDGDTVDQLFKSADLALYRAKASGKSAYRFFEAEMDAHARARRDLEFDLRQALVNEEFRILYQPVVNISSNRITGFEALLRWEHPLRGSVSPLEFIPLAEESGLINSIGEWVLKEACREAANWPQPLKIAVNLSPAQFKSARLSQHVVQALEQAHLVPSRLELEITESVLLQESEMTVSMLHGFRALGVGISLDDFGTGYSSLSYLRSFPFDKIKIDQSFIREMSGRPDCAAIVRAITDLGVNLGMLTTAEGVETEEQLSILRFEGCTEAQGYLFGRPMPSEDVLALLEKQQSSPNRMQPAA